ncbi:MAG: CehA/McbA family metallohydrolase [Acidobacteria bacterium]|nr:CehA/McbA family metallohydrolase [Acidobacteriota bacterium]
MRLLVLLAGCVALAAAQSVLEIAVTAGGKPTAARVYITGAGGKAYVIPGAITYTRRSESHSIVDGSATLSLPPGHYTVCAEKGAEFERAMQPAELREGKRARVALEIRRFHDMNAHGWYAGDLHVHREPGEMPLLMRAEELSIAPTITRHVGDGRPERMPFPKTPGLQNQEVERLRKGHGAVVLLNVPEPLPMNPATLFPMDVEFCRQARRQGGFVDQEKPIWKNTPVNVALGAVDAIGVVNNHFHPHDVMLEAETYGSMERELPVYKTMAGFAQWMMDLYYSFLNCGFRIPASAGSASGVMASWPGYERVYVRLNGALGYREWFEGLKAGRSIATNGPLLEVSVNGKPPGAEFKPGEARVSVEAHSQAPLERLEIVFNGEVLRSFRNISKGAFRKNVALEIRQPGWLAVRCFEPVTDTVRYAHTSPFYFTQDGKLPVKKSDALQWANYVRQLAQAAGVSDYPSRADYEQAQRTYAEAERVYRRLAE